MSSDPEGSPIPAAASAILGGLAGQQLAPPTAIGALLRDIVEKRALKRPEDLVSPIGDDGVTCWKLNTAQTLVVAGTARGAAIDDAAACGRIAVEAALAPIHAAAARPLFARLLCECPAGATDAAREAILEGAAVAMSDAGAILADARFVDAPVLRFELLAAGVVRPDRMRGPGGALPGDALVVSGPLGSGIYAAANERRKLPDADRRALLDKPAHATRVGIALGSIRNVHGVAVIGPGGLLSSALALGEAAGVDAEVDAHAVPVLPQALALARAGCVAPRSSTNWNRDGAQVKLDDRVMPEMRALLTDPQAGGALLIACKRESTGRVLELCRAESGHAAEVGRLHARHEDAAQGRVRIVVNA